MKSLPKPQTQWSGGGRVLLAEDEDMVRAVAESTLTRAGYTVTAASGGDEGLELVQAGGESDLIASGVVMPAMDGPTPFREVCKLRPALPVLFMPGYSEGQLRDKIGIARRAIPAQAVFGAADFGQGGGGAGWGANDLLPET